MCLTLINLPTFRIHMIHSPSSPVVCQNEWQKVYRAEERQGMKGKSQHQQTCNYLNRHCKKGWITEVARSDPLGWEHNGSNANSGAARLSLQTPISAELEKGEKNESLQMIYVDLCAKGSLYVFAAQISGKYNYSDGSLCNFHLYSKIRQLRAHARSLQV